MSKILITGGSGFIGSHLVDALIARGDEVTVLDWCAPTSERKNNQATYVLGDIRDSSLVEELIMQKKPEIVFHLAAHIDDRASRLDPVMNADHNIQGSLNVFLHAGRGGVKKILFASSCAVYGLQEHTPVKEGAVPCPQTPYGISKLAGEMYLFAQGREYGMITLAFRFANVYGPRQDGSKESGAIAIFTDKMIKNEQPYIYGDGKTVRDYVFVDDVVAALVAGSEKDISGVYNVGTGREVSTHTVFSLIKQSTGSVQEEAFREDIQDAVRSMSVDATRLQEVFGWKPKLALEEGIDKTVAWYKNRGNI